MNRRTVNELLGMIRKNPCSDKKGAEIMASSSRSAQFLIESRLADAARGNPQAYYDLGIAYSCGTGGVDMDLIAAHKWFNLAALAGSAHGQAMRAELAEEMTAREIAEAQRQARAWLAATATRHAA